MSRDDMETDMAAKKRETPSFLYYFHSLLLIAGRVLSLILDFYNKLFDFTSHDRAKIYGNLSTHYAKRDMYDKALQFTEKWVRADPSNPEAHFRHGIALADTDYPRTALDEFDKVLSLKPGHKGALMRKSSMLLRLKNYPEAAETLEKAIESMPKKARLHYMLGIAYEGLEEIDKAIEAVKRAIELDPEEIPYHQHLGFLNIRRDDHKTAAKSFTRVMELEREMDEQEEGPDY